MFAHLTAYLGQISKCGIPRPKLIHRNFDPQLQTGLLESGFSLFVWGLFVLNLSHSHGQGKGVLLNAESGAQTLAELARPLPSDTAGVFQALLRKGKGSGEPRDPPALGWTGGALWFSALAQGWDKPSFQEARPARALPLAAWGWPGVPAALPVGRGAGGAGPPLQPPAPCPLPARPPAASPPALQTWRGGTRRALPRVLGRLSGKSPGQPVPIPFPGGRASAGAAAPGWWEHHTVAPRLGPTNPALCVSEKPRSGRTWLWGEGRGGAAEGPAWVRACECVCVSVCRSGSTLMHTPTRPHSGSAPSAGVNLRGACLDLPNYPVLVPSKSGEVPQWLGAKSEAGCRAPQPGHGGSRSL